MKNNILFITLLGFIFQGCVSMSSLQTARTIDNGKSQQSVGGGIYTSQNQIAGTTTTTQLPYFEYSYRRGLADNWDAGLKLTFLGAYGADTKYQFYSDDKWAISAGLGLGYLSYKISAGNADSEVKYLDFSVPFYLSYDISKAVTLYTSPKYIYRSSQAGSNTSYGLTGLTLGSKIGEKSGVYLEATLFKGAGDQAVTQYNVSYFW